MWENITSYRRGAQDRTPRSWERRAGGLRITVSRHIDYAPDVWVLSCEPWYDMQELTARDIDAAKAEAVERVCTKLEIALSLLR